MKNPLVGKTSHCPEFQSLLKKIFPNKEQADLLQRTLGVDIEKLKTQRRGTLVWLESGAKQMAKDAGYTETSPEKSTFKEFC